MSSLKALIIDPEDPIGKQIMARVSLIKKHLIFIYFVFILKHLHTVLHNNDDKETVATMESELEQFNLAPLSNDNTVETINSGEIIFLELYLRRNKIWCVR
jgi:hypothetical protein